MFDEVRAYLKKKDLPTGDNFDLPTSENRFPDGAQYRIEVPTCNSPATFRAIMETAENHDVTVNRIDDTFGIMRYTDETILEFISIAKEYECEVNFSIGPRATYDISAQRATGTAEGNRIAYRLRGMEQIIRATEDAKRATELGARGILVYDEGHLWLLNEMRKDGEIPKDVHFKFSAHCGHGNPIAFRIIEQLGANSINPVRDLTLPMMSSLREAVNVALDLHTDNPHSTGGFVRTYEAPEIVRIAAPVHLKAGNSALRSHGIPTTTQEGINMGTQAVLVSRMVQKYFPEAKQSKKGAKGLAIPV
jgi:hypothetical protein